jgi:plastocyanin
MAERNFDFVETLGRKKRLICGSFVPNGSSAIDNTANTGKGFTVAYTSTGVYTVTFTDAYGAVAYCDAKLTQASRTQDVAVASCSASGKSMVIHGSDMDGTAFDLVDITAAAGTRVYFIAVFDDALEL